MENDTLKGEPRPSIKLPGAVIEVPKKPDLLELRTHYERELHQLTEFLGSTTKIWAQEVLNNYPSTLEGYPDSWIKQVEATSEETKWKLDCGSGLDNLPEGELLCLFKEIERLEQIERWPVTQENDYPSWALFKVSGKKQHEIHRIVPVVEQLGLKSGDDTFIDIGGGKGHLPRVLCLYHGHNGITLDSNEEFQELGLNRLKKYPAPQGAGTLEFVHHTFGEDTHKVEKDLFKKAKASIGLHTCGPLSIHHLSKAQKEKGLLNFPCCYNKLNPGNDTHLSNFLKRKPLTITKHALTLASRGHTTITFEDYLLKKQVKLMRSALHFFLQENYQLKDFITVGSAYARDYKVDFDHYARIKLQELGKSLPKENLNTFFEREDIQRKIHLVYSANIIRWRWGRILEKFLVYDRALSLVEEGNVAEVYQFFDEKLSPRNLGILIRP